MKKALFIGLGILALIIILLIATGSLKFSGRIGRAPTVAPASETPIPEGWGKYSSGEMGYSLLYPKDWNLKENNESDRRELLVLAPAGRAFVRIAALKDATLTSKETVEASIAVYKASFAEKKDQRMQEFKSSFEGSLGRFGVSGRMVLNNVLYQFLERGYLSTNGRVLIMRGGADTSEKYTQAEFETYAQTVKKIMDSFSIQ